MNHAREGEERGKGIPLDDAQRLARHLNITIEEACDLLRVYSVEELLPERGYCLTHSVPQPLSGTSISELGSALKFMEDSLELGDKARLELATYKLPTQDDLGSMWADMLASGFHTSKPTARVVDGVPLTSMVLTKGSPAWAALIPLLPVIITGALVAFGLAKIETIAKAITPLALILVSGAVIIALATRRPAR